MRSAIALEGMWRKNFLLSREELTVLLSELNLYVTPNPRTPNYHFLSAERKLAVTLYYLKDTGSMQMTANTFGIATSTLSHFIYQIRQTISTVLGPKYVKLPETIEEMQRKVAEFEGKYGMILAFGCVEGTHIAVRKPYQNSQDWFPIKATIH